MLGISCFIGLGVLCLFLPLNHFAGKVVINAQDNLMKARDERVSLMNEVMSLSISFDPISLASTDIGWHPHAQGNTPFHPRFFLETLAH